MERPRILVVDCKDETVDRLIEAKFNVTRGTFGTGFSCSYSEQLAFYFEDLDYNLPSLEEQDIVIVNTAHPIFTDY